MADYNWNQILHWSEYRLEENSDKAKALHGEMTCANDDLYFADFQATLCARHWNFVQRCDH